MSTEDCDAKRRFLKETAKNIYSLFYEEMDSLLYRCRASFKTPTRGWSFGNPDKRTIPADRNASAEGKNCNNLLQNYVPGIRENRSIGCR